MVTIKVSHSKRLISQNPGGRTWLPGEQKAKASILVPAGLPNAIRKLCDKCTKGSRNEPLLILHKNRKYLLDE